jgi:thiol-disulfide isomerase/thioredoxin
VATTAAGASSQARKQPSRSYRKPQRSFWQGPYPYLGILGAVLSVVLVVVIVSRLNTGGNPQTGNIEQAIHNATNVSESVFNDVGTGSLSSSSLPIQAVQNPTALTGSDGKPEVLYMGGEYCPYCAADRWVMLTALSRFGTFSGVQSMFSSSTDVYPNTPTFTFAHAKFTSQYVDFVMVEMWSRNANSSSAPDLEQPTAQQQQLMSTYDSGGGIPFLLIGGKFVGSTPYSPQDLAGKTQQQIAANLSDSSQQTTQDIIGNANLLTATICSVTGGQPSTVCQSPGVQKAGQLRGINPSSYQVQREGETGSQVSCDR